MGAVSPASRTLIGKVTLQHFQQPVILVQHQHFLPVIVVPGVGVVLRRLELLGPIDAGDRILRRIASPAQIIPRVDARDGLFGVRPIPEGQGRAGGVGGNRDRLVERSLSHPIVFARFDARAHGADAGADDARRVVGRPGSRAHDPHIRGLKRSVQQDVGAAGAGEVDRGRCARGDRRRHDDIRILAYPAQIVEADGIVARRQNPVSIIVPADIGDANPDVVGGGRRPGYGHHHIRYRRSFTRDDAIDSAMGDEGRRAGLK